jgi:hypothetical protein
MKGIFEQGHTFSVRNEYSRRTLFAGSHKAVCKFAWSPHDFLFRGVFELKRRAKEGMNV